MRIIRVEDQVLLFDGTGQLIDGTSIREADERLARLYVEGEYLGLYPVTVRHQHEEQAHAAESTDS